MLKHVEDVLGVVVALVVIVGLAVAAAWVMAHDVPRTRKLYSPDETCTCIADPSGRVRDEGNLP